LNRTGGPASKWVTRRRKMDYVTALEFAIAGALCSLMGFGAGLWVAHYLGWEQRED